MNVFFVSVGLMEFYVLSTIKTFYENAESVSYWDVWIYNLPCVFSFLSVVVQLESEKDFLLVVLLEVLFDSLLFCAIHEIFLIVWKVVSIFLTR